MAFVRAVNYLKFSLIATICFGAGAFSACAYRVGAPDRMIPGGYKQLAVPIFRNHTQEVGIEVGFTNSLVTELERSRTARVVDAMHAEAQIDGEILSVQYQAPSSDVTAPTLPTGSVLKTSYTIVVKSKVTLRRRADQQILWAGEFRGERTFTSSQVTQFGVNTVNPLYNLSARRQNIEQMATDLMAEAHDRMSESF